MEALQQLVLDGVASSSTARRDSDLAIDGLEVRVDGAGTDDELVGDLGVGHSLSQQT